MVRCGSCGRRFDAKLKKKRPIEKGETRKFDDSLHANKCGACHIKQQRSSQVQLNINCLILMDYSKSKTNKGY